MRGLTKEYGDVKALCGLDMCVEEGSVVGILGPNGAGKTTALKIAAGLMKPTSGAVRVFGREPASAGLTLRRLTGYVEQNPRMHGGLTAIQTLSLVARLHYKGEASSIDAIAQESLDSAGLAEKGSRRVRDLSGGERQRLALAAALVGKPRLLILDEPMTGLDPLGRRDVTRLLMELAGKVTVLYSTHILEDVHRIAQSVVLMDRGRTVAAGKIDELAGAVAGPAAYVAEVTGYSMMVHALLEQQPWVVRLRVESAGTQTVLKVWTDDAGALESNLLRLLLSDPGVSVKSFVKERAKLEDLFVRLLEGGEGDGD